MATTTADLIEATSPWLSPAGAARELGLSRDMVQILCNRGQLVHQRTPLGRLIDRGSVAQLKETRAARRQRDAR